MTANLKEKLALTPKFSKEKVKKIWTEAFAKETSPRKDFFNGYLFLCVLFNLSVTLGVIALIYFKYLPPQIPLFYGSPDGEGQLSINWFLILPSILCILFIIINSMLNYSLKDEFLKRSLFVSSLTITLLSAVTTIKIVSLVGNL